MNNQIKPGDVFRLYNGEPIGPSYRARRCIAVNRPRNSRISIKMVPSESPFEAIEDFTVAVNLLEPICPRKRAWQ